MNCCLHTIGKAHFPVLGCSVPVEALLLLSLGYDGIQISLRASRQWRMVTLYLQELPVSKCFRKYNGKSFAQVDVSLITEV